ncbi:HEAT repeat domain-containing protein [Actinoplanes sp. NPDC049548]|uniref:HEAT repeat domain-containing protein n=1 Tax=Actinoplanes sp. NPDC049548 TaxID=3155152 RepID=UPI003424AFD5
MLDELDRVDWAAPGHGHGPAEDVSELVPLLTHPDADTRAAAAQTLARCIIDPALLTRLLGSSSADLRRAAVRALTLRCQASRSAPAVLVPLLGPALHDPEVRDEAVSALRRCGRAAARHADVLSEVAAGYPAGAAREAVETLMLLGDPRWVGPVVQAALDGAPRAPRTLTPPPCPPAVLDAVRAQLTWLAAAPGATAAVELLCEVVARWETGAAAAVPELLAALPQAPVAATRALLAVGHAAAPMIPGLRAAATRPGGLLAATALFRLTGDPAPALRALLTARPPVPPGVVALLGPLAQPLVPELELLLTGAAAATQPQCAAQVLAAQIVIAATGDTTAALPTLYAVLTAGGPRAALATTVVTDLAGGTGGWRGEMRVWEPDLRALLGDASAGVGAAGALWRLGVPAGELVPALVGAIERGRRVAAAIELLREMGADAELTDLAGRDVRLAGAGADLVSTDELLRARMLSP